MRDRNDQPITDARAGLQMQADDPGQTSEVRGPEVQVIFELPESVTPGASSSPPSTASPGPALGDWLRRQLRALGRRLELVGGSITVLIVDDGRMSELAGQYRGESVPTDVLGFDLREDEADPALPIEADLVVCLDQARREAEKRGHSVGLELLLYALHGLLHMLGEDDHEPGDYQRMHQREDDLLEQIGVGGVFRIRPANPGP